MVKGSAADAEQDLCDFLCSRLLGRLDMETGYKGGDSHLLARHLAKVLRLYSKDPDVMTFEEFHEAFLRLCFVGQQRGLEALYRRFDFEGTGLLSIDRFVAGVSRSLPNPAASPPIRVAFTNVRGALRKAAGIYAVTKYMAHLKTKATVTAAEGVPGLALGSPLYTVSLAAIRDAWAEVGAKLREQDVTTALREIDVNSRGNVEIDDVALAHFGALSRTKRELASRVWADVAGSEEAVSADVLIGRMTSEEAQSELAGVLSLVSSPSASGEGWDVTYREWIDLCKGVAASLCGDDAAFAGWIGEFGVDTVVTKGSVLLGGSLSFGLHQTLTAKGIVA